ncbi:MAG: DUF1585 domain-containing protein [Proteobacteria bacterium]|nr:DUF1585 domain-containing protein [Pseudomonadota bacterium]
MRRVGQVEHQHGSGGALRGVQQQVGDVALGRRTHPSDRSTVRSIVRSAAENDHRLSSIVMGIATSDAFRMQEAGPVVAQRQE